MEKHSGVPDSVGEVRTLEYLQAEKKKLQDFFNGVITTFEQQNKGYALEVHWNPIETTSGGIVVSKKSIDVKILIK